MLKNNFFGSQFGNYADLPFWRKRQAGRLTDVAFEFRLRLNASYRELERRASEQDPLNVLVVGVDVKSRSSELQRVFDSLESSRHNVTFRKAPLLEGYGKFQNINRSLPKEELGQFDWLIVLDDDIKVRPRFLDEFLYLAEQQKLKICMPAHRFHSYLGFAVTQRHWNSLTRVTHFVECGPLTAFHRDAFGFCVPFPETRWAWGVDVLWSELARERECAIGIVDACPIEHLRPVGGTYNGRAARIEAEQLLEEHGVHRHKSEVLTTVSVMRELPS